MLIGTVGTHKNRGGSDWDAKPFCQCWNKRAPVMWKQLSVCNCGEEYEISEWKWEVPLDEEGQQNNSVVMSDNNKQVTFHPFYSSGTAFIRGDTPMELDNHYYFEVKMLSETYGTDIMIGIGTNKVSVQGSHFKFSSLLGEDNESYGLSYRGTVRHQAQMHPDSAGFCRGTIVGVRVDMWQGTLEFYLNRKPQGIAFYNLRRHQTLYPMACSTAAQSVMKLIYAASWRASLLVDAAKTLAASVRKNDKLLLPPGLERMMKWQFWLTLSTDGPVLEDKVENTMEIDSADVVQNVLTEVLPSQYMNGFYVDGVDRTYRMVVYQ